MSHQVEILDYKTLSNGQFAIATRCCGDDVHVTWHTMDASVVIDADKMEASLNEHCSIMAQHHEAALQAEDSLKKLVGTSRQHSGK